MTSLQTSIALSVLALASFASATAFGMPGDRNPGGASSARLTCELAHQRYGEPWRDLVKELQPNIVADPRLVRLAEMSPRDCANATTRRELVALLADATTAHSGTIGVFLPLTGLRSEAGRAAASGVQAAFAGATSESKKQTKLVVVDTGLGASHIRRELASLLFRDRLSAIIHLPTAADGHLLTSAARGIGLPILMLGPADETTNGSEGRVSPSVFRVFPQTRTLAESLVRQMQAQGVRRLAIVRPSANKAGRITGAVKAAALAAGITITDELSYLPGNFDSMDAVARALFGIDTGERRGEWQQAMRAARLKAERQGVGFNPRMVSLKPIINTDAVFLPDDFRTVRHFAKIFRFHGVNRLAMFGNHEWRSPGLLEPWDDFIDGAVFGDFVSSYANLPPGISAPTIGSHLFADPTTVAGIDWQLIGWRAGDALQRVLSGARVHRRQLSRGLRNLPNPRTGMFAATGARTFDSQRTANWPGFVFRTSNRSIHPIGFGTQDAVVSASSGKDQLLAPRKTVAQKERLKKP